MIKEIKGRQLDVDEDGYLINPEDWDKDVAERMAAEEEVELTEAHWEIITVAQEFYAEHKFSPRIKMLVQFVNLRLGDSKGNTKYLYELFPAGPSKQASKIAGLPQPCDCCC